ncbi:hypothetical protein Tco_1167746, partial [Tanacetum coccineum]
MRNLVNDTKKNFNETIVNTKKCDDFYWIDPELNSPWYKYQIFELYVTQHPEQRFLFVEHLRAQDQLERLQVKHDRLVSKFKQSKKKLQIYEDHDYLHGGGAYADEDVF